MIQLKILLPSRVLLDEPVKKVSFEAVDGAFTLLPRHIDFVAPLVPGLFSYVSEADKQVFLAMAEGILVKRGSEIMVSTRNAVIGDDLQTLWQTVREQFTQLSEQERHARNIMISLESTLARELAILEDQDY